MMIKCDKCYFKNPERWRWNHMQIHLLCYQGNVLFFPGSMTSGSFKAMGEVKMGEVFGGSDGSFALSVRSLQVFSATFQSSGERKLAAGNKH